MGYLKMFGEIQHLAFLFGVLFLAIGFIVNLLTSPEYLEETYRSIEPPVNVESSSPDSGSTGPPALEASGLGPH